MTYAQLLTKLMDMNQEQLNSDIAIYDRNEEEVFSLAGRYDFVDFTKRGDKTEGILHYGHPYFNF